MPEQSTRRRRRGSADTTRTEAFSDGVMAVAITLLVLDLQLPDAFSGDHLLGDLGAKWPQFAAYVVSFATIGVIWINHHAVFTLIDRVDRMLMAINLFALLTVTFIPYTTRLIEHALAAGSDERPAAMVYGFSLLLMGMGMGLLFTYATRRTELRAEHVQLAGGLTRATVLFTLGSVVYIVAIPLALIDYRITLALAALMAVYYTVFPVEAL